MPTVLLIGIPIVVAILLWAILSLPDEEEKEEGVDVMEPEAVKKPKSQKSVKTKKKTR